MANYWTSATQHFGEGFQTRGPLVNFLGAPHSYYSNHRKWPGACQNFKFKTFFVMCVPAQNVGYFTFVNAQYMSREI